MPKTNISAIFKVPMEPIFMAPFFHRLLYTTSAIILAPPAKSINWKLKIYKIIEAHLLMCYTGKEQASCNVTCVYEEKELRH